MNGSDTTWRGRAGGSVSPPRWRALPKRIGRTSSDRALCYLASGKPVVVQNTGPSSFLPDGEGMFRFSSPREAADALEAANEDYGRHSRAARQIAEAFFDARQVAEKILSDALA